MGYKAFSDSELRRLEACNEHALDTLDTGRWNLDMVLCWARMFATFRGLVKEREEMKSALAAQCMRTIGFQEKVARAEKEAESWSSMLRVLDKLITKQNARTEEVAEVLGKHIPNEEKIKALRKIVNQHD